MQYNTEKVKNLFNKSDEQIIERILTLKQILQENRASPVDYHDLAIHYFFLKITIKQLILSTNCLKDFLIILI